MLKLFSPKLLQWLTVFVSLIYVWVGTIGQNGWVLCYESDGHVVLEQSIGDSPLCCDKRDIAYEARPDQPILKASCKECVDVPLGHLLVSQANQHDVTTAQLSDIQIIAFVPEHTVTTPIGYLALATMQTLAKPPPFRPKPHLGFLKTIRLLI